METKFIKGISKDADLCISMHDHGKKVFFSASVCSDSGIARTSLWLDAAGLRELAMVATKMANDLDPPKVDGATETSYEDYLDWVYHNNVVAK